MLEEIWKSSLPGNLWKFQEFSFRNRFKNVADVFLNGSEIHGYVSIIIVYPTLVFTWEDRFFR